MPSFPSNYVNINDIAERFDKRIDNWMRLKETKKILQDFKRDASPVMSIEGRKGGTFVHPEIAVQFVQWCEKLSPDRPDHVYFISAFEMDIFKIGVSCDSKKRLDALQIGSPVKLILLRDTECKNAVLTEKKIHKHFDKHRSHGEWFSYPIRDALVFFDSFFK